MNPALMAYGVPDDAGAVIVLTPTQAVIMTLVMLIIPAYILWRSR